MRINYEYVVKEYYRGSSYIGTDAMYNMLIAVSVGVWIIYEGTIYL